MISYTRVAARIIEELSGLICVRGYQVYQDVWEEAIGEILICEREPNTNNSQDRYTVAVKKEGSIVDQLPNNVSRVC